MPPLNIRPARVNDIDAIFDVRTSVIENHLSRQQLAELGITEDAVAQMLDPAVPCIWVAETDAGVIGFSIADHDEGSLFALFVRPEWEGRGAGRALLQAAETPLLHQHPAIWLETAANSRAARFYARAGWAIEKAVGENDVRMTKHRHEATAPR